MFKKLIITEKPDVARNFANFVKAKKVGSKLLFINNNYVIIPCFGHLLRLKDMKDYDLKYEKWELENYPYFPDKFEFKLPDDKGVVEQFELINKFSNSDEVECVINGCDNDREGELIGAITISQTGTNKAIYRLLYDAITFEDFSNGMRNLIPNKNRKNVQSAAYGRLYSDWIIGINLTSVATLKLSETNNALNIGRVILPITKFVYDREIEIENFEPQVFYELKTKIKINNNEIEAVYFDDKNNSRFDKNFCENIKKKLKNIKIKSLEKKVTSSSPEKLHSLTSFTRHLTKNFKGFNTKNVSSIYQGLYEKGYLSYPRTESRYLKESEAQKFEKIFNELKEAFDFCKDAVFEQKNTVFNDKKVVSHSALTPTNKIPNMDNLDDREQTIYLEVVKSFISQFMNKAKYEATNILFDYDGYLFKALGKTLVDKGYLSLYPNTSISDFPSINKGDSISLASPSVHEGKTSKPSRLTEADLLGLMETVGKNIDEAAVEDLLKGYSIGTAATRNGSIEKVKDIGYIKLKGKSLYITETGRKLIENFPTKKLLNPEFTGYMGKLMMDIELGNMSLESFLDGIKALVSKSIEDIKKMENVTIASYDDIKVCNCKLCGKSIVETESAFGCTGYKEGCKFIVFKSHPFFKNFDIRPTKGFIKNLIENNFKIIFLNLYSKKKKRNFDANIIYSFDEESGYWNFSLDFDVDYDVIGKCPKCNNGDVLEKGMTFSCSECDFRLFRKNKFFEGKLKKPKELKRSDVNKLIKSSYFVKNLINKEGKEYKARIGLDENKKYLKIVGFVKS